MSVGVANSAPIRPMTSLVVSRAVHADDLSIDETFLPASLLAGILPDAIRTRYHFWQCGSFGGEKQLILAYEAGSPEASCESAGAPIRHHASTLLAIELLQWGFRDSQGFCCGQGSMIVRRFEASYLQEVRKTTARAIAGERPTWPPHEILLDPFASDLALWRAVLSFTKI